MATHTSTAVLQPPLLAPRKSRRVSVPRVAAEELLARLPVVSVVPRVVALALRNTAAARAAILPILAGYPVPAAALLVRMAMVEQVATTMDRNPKVAQAVGAMVAVESEVVKVQLMVARVEQRRILQPEAREVRGAAMASQGPMARAEAVAGATILRREMAEMEERE